MKQVFKLFEEEQDPEITTRNEQTRDWKIKKQESMKKKYWKDNQSMGYVKPQIDVAKTTQEILRDIDKKDI